jgi:putative heme transporter
MDANRGYIAYFFILSNIILTIFVLIAGRFIISPLLAATFMAILLNPLYSKLYLIGLPRILSAVISVLFFFLCIAVLISFITAQLGFIAAGLAASLDTLGKLVNRSQQWISEILPYPLQVSTRFVEDSFTNFIRKMVSYIPNVFIGTTTYLSMFVLFFVSLFFFLYYRDFFISFIFQLTNRNNKNKLKETITKIKNSINNYIVGLFTVITIVATLNSIGLLLLGIKYAIFFGILGALLTIVPYIGIVIGSLLPAIFALLSSNSFWHSLWIILLFSFVQFLEGNFITPNIIGSKENVNPCIAIFGLFFGGMLLGAIGMILAIPLLGIIKIICDDIDYLKPIGYLIGMPEQKYNNQNFIK